MGQAIARLLNVLGLLLRARGVDAETIEVLETAEAAVKVHQGRQENLVVLADMLRTMVDEGRAPNDAELGWLRDVRADLSRRAQAVDLSEDRDLTSEERAALDTGDGGPDGTEPLAERGTTGLEGTSGDGSPVS